MDRIYKPMANELLDILNTPEGLALLGIKEEGKVVKVTPNSVHFLVGFEKKTPIIKAYFWESNIIDKKISPVLEKIRIACLESELSILERILNNKSEAYAHFSGLKNSRHLPQVYLAMKTFNPNSGGSGRVFGSFVGTWASARSATTGTANAIHAIYTTFSSPNYRTDRTFYSFDTSSIGGATPTSAFIKLYRDDTIIGFTNTDTTSVEITQSTQTSATALANSDLGNVGFTSGGTINLASTTNNSYAQITLTATGLGFLNTSGYSKLAGLSGLDVNNVAPTGVNQIGFQNSAAANPPVLSITYPAAGSSFLLNFV